jgi:hypothetical protein
MKQFAVPYLETERGRNCALRKFLPETIFRSAQFDMLAPESSSSSTTSSSSSAKVVTNGEANDVITQEGDSWFKEIKVGYNYFFYRITENHFIEGNIFPCNYVFMILEVNSISPYKYFGLQ